MRSILDTTCVRFEGHRLGHLVPAEGQQLSGERGGAFHGAQDLSTLARNVSAAPRVQQHVAVAGDDGEQSLIES